MTSHCDILVVGGGPAGAAAAWRAARSGANVVCLDKAEFPRDKPCGDGLTPRAVKLISGMGLEDDLTKFHRVDAIRFFTRSVWEVPWPQRPGLPTHAYVARRLDLDEMLLRNAGRVGARVEQNTEVVEPLVEDGRVVGVIANRDGAAHTYRAEVVIAADGAHSRLKRSLNVQSNSGLVAIAIRAEMSAQRVDDSALETYLMKHGRNYFPGYGWVFPLGDSRFNLGVGYLTSYRRWREINARTLFEQFTRQLPAEWQLPDMSELNRAKALQAWRLPMGFSTRPAWRPGIIFAGDAAGVAKPMSGAGISKALQSGIVAAEVAVDALGSGSPSELSKYDRQLRRLWGIQYQLSRAALRLGSNPHVIALTLNSVDNRIGRTNLIRVFYGRSGAVGYQNTTPTRVSLI